MSSFPGAFEAVISFLPMYFLILWFRFDGVCIHQHYFWRLLVEMMP
jgi:hypothetical protein